jgi:hypothetical protein
MNAVHDRSDLTVKDVINRHLARGFHLQGKDAEDEQT